MGTAADQTFFPKKKYRWANTYEKNFNSTNHGNANRNYAIPSNTSQMAIIKKIINTMLLVKVNYEMKYYSDIQKNENLLCDNMDRIRGYQLVE